jgi:hypothetical protein
VDGSNFNGLFGHLRDTNLNGMEGLVLNGHRAALGLGGLDEGYDLMGIIEAYCGY